MKHAQFVSARSVELAVRHAEKRLKRCRDREALAAVAYHKRVRESERAAFALRHQQRQMDSVVVSDAVNAGVSLWEAQS